MLQVLTLKPMNFALQAARLKAWRKVVSYNHLRSR